MVYCCQRGMTADALIRAAGELGCPTLQLGITSRKELLDAREHPERHPELVVRISGFSAYFTALTEKVQNEIISRTPYAL